jgi:hypothetical protein
VSCRDVFEYIRKQEELMNKLFEEHIKFMYKLFEQAMKEFEQAVKKDEGVYDGYFISIRIENGKPYVKYYRFSNKPFGEELKDEAKDVVKAVIQV